MDDFELIDLKVTS